MIRKTWAVYNEHIREWVELRTYDENGEKYLKLAFKYELFNESEFQR